MPKVDETMSPEISPGSIKRIAVITFFTFAARGLAIPFVGLYLKSVGLQGTEIGLLTSLSALVQLLVTPFLNNLADRSGAHRRLYYGLLVSNAFAAFAMVATAANRFLLGGAIILRDSSDTPSAALLSQLTITWLDQRKRDIYGRLRAWGSLGWAVTTFVSGRIYAAGGYPLLFILYSLCNIILIPLVSALPERTAKRQPSHVTLPPRSWAFYMLLASLFLFAIGNNAYSTFSFIYFQQNLAATNELIGIVSSVAALSEIPSMMFIDWLLRRTNMRTTLIIGMAGQAILWIGFTLLTGSAALIPLMIFRGTFFTFFNVSATLLVSRISHPANVATNQALAQVTVPALAVLIAGSINGWLFDNAGPYTLFRIAAFTAILAAGLLVAVRHQIAAQDSRMQALRQAEAPAI